MENPRVANSRTGYVCEVQILAKFASSTRKHFFAWRDEFLVGRALPKHFLGTVNVGFLSRRISRQ